MAQTGYTPILLYGSTTASNTPSASNLTTSASGVELAVNAADGKLFYKDTGGTVQVIGSKATGAIGGSTTQVQYNNGGVLGGSANLTFNGTTLTAAGLAGPLNGTVGATTPNTGAFTTLSASSTVSGTGFSTYLASPPAIGGTAPSTGKFTSLTDTGLTSGRVPYSTTGGLLTDAAGFTFDGTNLTTQIKAYKEYIVTNTSVTTTYAIDLSVSNIFNLTMTGNTTFSFTNLPSSGIAYSIMLILRQDATGSRIATWPASIKWSNGTTPTLATGANKVDILNLVTVDGGTTYYGALSLANM